MDARKPCLKKFVTCAADEGGPETWCENCREASAPGNWDAPSRDVMEQELRWVRKFIEYARYELQPGEQQVGDQFPRQDAADKAMAKIDGILAKLTTLRAEQARLKEAVQICLSEVRGGGSGWIQVA
jgi:hypothetical protein